MRWTEWVVVIAAFVVAGWFAIDGLMALASGDYVTPSSGPQAGQLGPWSKVVSAIGIDPRSNLMKWVFVVYGMTWLGVIAGYLLRQPWAPMAMLIAAIGSLWYWPFGTLLGLIQIILLIVALPQT